jgi:hypothetical protein
MKDITPLRPSIKTVEFVRNDEGFWEIYFYIGEEKPANRHTVTKHYPSNETRSWKSLDNVYSAAEEIFGNELDKFIIIKARKS